MKLKTSYLLVMNLKLLSLGKIEVCSFKIEKLWDIETDEEIESVSPGKKGQLVKIYLPIVCENNWIIRRRK